MDEMGIIYLVIVVIVMLAGMVIAALSIMGDDENY